MPKHIGKFLLSGAVYMLLLVLSLRWMEQGQGSLALRILISLMPMLAVGLIFWSILKVLHELDELQRKVQLEAFALAFAGTAMLTFGYGFLENAGLPRLSLFAVWPLMAALWAGGVFWGNWRYR